MRLYAKEHADVIETCAPLLGKLGSVRVFERATSPLLEEAVRDDAFEVAITQTVTVA